MRAAVAGPAIPVLLYHGVAGDASAELRRFTVSPAAFDQQMTMLAEEGYTTLTVSGFLPALHGNTAALPPKPALVTFDDGFANTLTEALPILERHGFASTLYATTGFLGDVGRGVNRSGDAMLSWAELAELAGRGMEIGAHTHSHPMLDTLPPEAARDEIARSKDLIEQALGAPVRSFAYPHGYSSAAVRRMVADAGYSSACAVKNALSHPADDRFAIARLTIEAGHSLENVAAMIDGRTTRLAPSRERLRTTGWRWARRGLARYHRARERA